MTSQLRNLNLLGPKNIKIYPGGLGLGWTLKYSTINKMRLTSKFL